MVLGFMTAVRSGCGASGFAAARFEPVAGAEGGGFTGEHSGQAGEDVFEVFTPVDPKTAAVFDEVIVDFDTVVR
jgi:hypothetical protein